MVQLIPTGDKRGWVEEPPDPCPGRHQAWMSYWSSCPQGCGTMGRTWRCKVCAVVAFDYDHTCPVSTRTEPADG